jgi:hypothetical protein
MLDMICLDSCRRFQTIVVNTTRNVYEMVVLRGESGDVMVRGGSTFPEFRRVRFMGSRAADAPFEVNTIDVGLRMTFCVDDGIIITSPVKALTLQQEDRHDG